MLDFGSPLDGIRSPLGPRRGGFNPCSLFSSTAIGIWLDPSDVANLSWRRNLATQTEALHTYTFLNSPTVTANAATAPDGTMTATQFEVGAGQTAFLVRSVGPNQVAGNNANSIYFKLVGATIGVLGVLRASRDPNYCGVNVSTLAPLTNNAAGVSNSTVAIDTLPNGWYRLRSGYTNDTSEEGRIQFSASTAGTKILLWGVQVEQGSVTATDYQRISDVNTEVIERFPSATMYQDAAGTTAVTTPGQPVGLRLDKSKGLAFGPELAEGWLDSSTGWTFDAGWSLSSGSIVGGSGGNSTYASKPLTTVAGRWYRVDINVASLVGTLQFSVRQDSVAGASLSNRDIAGVTGNFSLYFLAATTTSVVRFGDFLTSVVVSSISVRELAGNHATQSVLASRPVYGIEPAGGRRNLLLNTDVLSTQSVTVTAVEHVLSFTGTGTVTLSGASTAGPLVGTGASNRVSLSFTPTAASLTLTVSGSVTLAQLERA